MMTRTPTPQVGDSAIAGYGTLGDWQSRRGKKWLGKLEMLPEETPYRSIYIAIAHAALGHLNEFFIWARRASEEKATNFGILRLIDRDIPAMRNIRQDPRFKELFKKVGLEA